MLGVEFWSKYCRMYDILNSFPPYTQLLTCICKELQPNPGDLVLDVGSGTGNLAIHLEAMGCRVVGVDYCLEALSCHRIKDGTSSLLLVDLMHGLPFVNNSFDCIVSNNVLYALPASAQIQVAKDLYRIMKPGGKITLANPRTGWSAMALYCRALSTNAVAEGKLATAKKATSVIMPTIRGLYYNQQLAREGRFHYHYFQPDEQRKLLQLAGFRPVSDTKLVYADQAVMDSAVK